MPIIKYDPSKPLYSVPNWFLDQLDNYFCNFKNKDFYKKYLKLVKSNFKKEVLPRFPLLKIVHRYLKPSYIYGYNILKETLDDINPSESDYYKYGIYMLAYILNYNPIKKRQEAARIYDYCRFIDSKFLTTHHNDICHIDNVENLEFYHICTNKSAEINQTNFIYTPIAVARTLYVEYLYVDNGGQFRLDCYEHGGDY